MTAQPGGTLTEVPGSTDRPRPIQESSSSHMLLEEQLISMSHQRRLHYYPDPGPNTEPLPPLQGPPSYYGLHDIVPAVTPVGEIVLEEGEVAGEKLDQTTVGALLNADYGNLRAMVWRYCGCGWGWRTTYKGLRQHQVEAGCGWDSDRSRTTGLRPTKATRPAWSPRAQKGYDKKEDKPSHPVTRPSSPVVLRSAATTAPPGEEQTSIADPPDAPPAH